jgi:hypothetical protein
MESVLHNGAGEFHHPGGKMQNLEQTLKDRWNLERPKRKEKEFFF